jgi:hypothetical protein
MKNKIKLNEEYEYVCFFPFRNEHILLNKYSQNLEVWFANKNHASFGLIYKNTHLEFARSFNKFSHNERMFEIKKEKECWRLYIDGILTPNSFVFGTMHNVEDIKNCMQWILKEH